jgi:2-polyprenyl-3-methyl-5-hydroxy-6-metoxy-1,4-benzoquinol methylase
MIIEKQLGISPEYQFNAYNSKNFFQRNWHRNKFDSIDLYLSYIHDLSKKNVLDIGTGSGNFEIYKSKKFKKIIGLDYNNDAINFLSKKLKEQNISNVEAKIFDLRNFKQNEIPEAIDIVIMVDVIEHVSEENAMQLFKVLKNKLKDDSKIIIITPNYSSLWLIIEKVLDRLTIVPKFDGAQHIAKYNSKTLNNLFQKIGYENVVSTSINTFSFLFPFEYINKLINKIEFFSNFKNGNLLVAVYQKKLNKIKKINIWNKIYGQDQENLYKNIFVKSIFDLGHQFIAKNGVKRGDYLDFGSGMGYHLNFETLDRINKYICMDINNKTLQLIKKNSKVKIKITDGKTIPLASESVDNIIASHILEHAKNIDSLLYDFKRVLKKDGKLLVVIPCDPGMLWKILSKMSPSKRRLQMNGLNYEQIMKHEHVNEAKVVIKKLKNNFKISKINYFPFFIPFINTNLIIGIECKKL